MKHVIYTTNITNKPVSAQEVYDILAAHGIWATVINGDYFPKPEGVELDEKAPRDSEFSSNIPPGRLDSIINIICDGMLRHLDRRK